MYERLCIGPSKFPSFHCTYRTYQRLLYDAYMGTGDNIAVRVAGTGQCIGNER